MFLAFVGIKFSWRAPFLLETNIYSISTVSPYNKHFFFFKYERKILARYFPSTIVDSYVEIYSKILTSTGIGSYVDKETTYNTSMIQELNTLEIIQISIILHT